MDKSPSKQRVKSRQSLAHISSRSNTTTDIAALRRDEENKAKTKRTRGKSLGPGGLEALTETSGNAFRVPPVLQPKSILKPTVPLTPPRAIPSFHELRNKSTTKPKSPAKNGSDDLLIDFSTPGSKRGSNNASVDVQGKNDPFSPHGVIQDDPAFEEQERLRQEEKKRALEHRAARKKSMGARRVSFAPEATLHTWSVMEMMEDSTTSSAANTTRRQSSMNATPSAGQPQTQNEDLLPQIESNELILDNSHVSQRGLHQRKRRRISDQSQSEEDDTFSSPGDGIESSPIRVEDGIESDSDTDGDTAMSLEEATQNTVGSSGSSSTQTSLDERLRSAASQAGIHDRVFDSDGSDTEESDNEDQPMDIADSTITHAFRGYGKQPVRNTTTNHAEKFDSEDNNATYPDLSSLEPDQTEMGMTMDITRAVGGIISNQQSTRSKNQKLTRTSIGNETSFGDETMDMTVAKGGILSANEDAADDGQYSDEDMTMEMTRAVGGIRAFPRSASASMLTEETESMDMTMAQGGILPPIEEQTEPQSIAGDDYTSAMDMTKAIGGILAQPKFLVSASPAVSHNDETSIHESFRSLPSASETGSPTMKTRSARRSIPATISTTPCSIRTIPAVRSSSNSPSRKFSSPVRGVQSTPSKQLTPAPVKSVSAKRTPILPASVATRGASPKKLFTKELQQRASPGQKKSPSKRQDVLFSQDTTTGLQTPKVVLHAPKPHQHLRRRSSGVGLDIPGTGSPRISEMLSTRRSIGEVASEFQLNQEDQKRLRFEDPKVIEQEIDRERAEEQRRESGRFVMEQEASQTIDDDRNGSNSTANLRDMIQSMTPKKDSKQSKMRARKSLAVGSARGLLGKRPIELDVDDDEEEGTPKRLKTISREGSPVKKVHLPKPPSKEETTGRLNRAHIAALDSTSAATPTLSSPSNNLASSPSRAGHFRTPQSSEKPVSFEQRLDNVFEAADIALVHPDAEVDGAEEKIGLQEFLNMTNIHFIELSTTKRRHTTMAATELAEHQADDQSSGAVFKAAATTLPLLDLYQHATRELKSYISSGRKIIRQIEEETLAEQPVLFKRYLDASPEMKLLMDNQFRSGKSNARLHSKEGWYTWRRQLVEGLQAGLDGIKTEMLSDMQVLTTQQASLNTIVPAIEAKNKTLNITLTDLHQRVEQLDSIDHDLLKLRRQELARVAPQLSSTSSEAEGMRQRLQSLVELLESATEMKQEISAQVDEALRVQDEQRTWRAGDVESSLRSIKALEAQYGWKILDATTVNNGEISLRMKYNNELILEMSPSQFISGSTSAQGSMNLTHELNEDDRPLTIAQVLMLAALKKYVQSVAKKPPGTTTSQVFLQSISEGWTFGKKLENEIKSLERLGVVRSTHNNVTLNARLMLMLPQRGRVDITFTASPTVDLNGKWSTTTNISVSAIHGKSSELPNPARISKIQGALTKEAEAGSLGSDSWFDAVRGFKEWLRSRDTAPKPEQQAIVPPEIISPKVARTASIPPVSPQRARTISPSTVQNQSTTPRRAPPRSPLAPKTTNSRIAKRAMSVTKKVQHESLLPQPTNFRESQFQKENLPQPAKQVSVAHDGMSYDEAFGLKNGIKPAISPEEQEAMMTTPMKRRNALRRSPI